MSERPRSREPCLQLKHKKELATLGTNLDKARAARSASAPHGAHLIGPPPHRTPTPWDLPPQARADLSDAEARLRAEIDAVLGPDTAGDGDGGGGDSAGVPCDGDLTYSTLLNKMPWLKACVYEALRLHPPVPMDFKVAARDDVLPGRAHRPAPRVLRGGPDRAPERTDGVPVSRPVAKPERLAE